MFIEHLSDISMEMPRIVSFLPSATELIYEFNGQDMLYGVTHECTFPDDAKTKPRVIESVIDSERLNSNEINQMNCRLLNEGKDIFILNEKNLKDANPDLIISQETCEVCAAYKNQVSKALHMLEKKPFVYSMDPHNIEGIITTVEELGKILGKEQMAKEIQDKLRKRISNITKISHEELPTVLAIEWLDPLFTAGHWIPEIIEYSGGINLISKKGEHSKKMDFEDIVKTNPEIIILMPCGFGLKRTINEYKKTLKEKPEWNELQAVQNDKVFAVDANSYFSKPSIRTITGLEILGKIIHQERFGRIKVPRESYCKI